MSDTAKSQECRRCSECQFAEHHWLSNPYFGDEEAPVGQHEYEYACKHCPAKGEECRGCQGSGRGHGDQGECVFCGGFGVVATEAAP